MAHGVAPNDHFAARGDYNWKDDCVAVPSDHSIWHQILDVMNSDVSPELVEPASARDHRREDDDFVAAQGDHGIRQHSGQILHVTNSDASSELVEPAGGSDENR